MKREYLPIDTLPAWQCLNGIVTKGIAFQKLGSSEHGTDKGSAIVATEVTSSDENDTTPEILLQIPSDLVLSLETVHNFAKSDRYLRDVLEAIGDFGRTARGAIMVFLLVQLSHTSPDLRAKHEHIGVSNPWTEYVKFLPPSFPLPTFYTTEEQELLRGTSLAEALDAKLISLQREFENLCQATEGIKWCQQSWWDEENGSLTIQDWKYVDAAYRSRMLDIPGSGLAMVPCIDMANHACGDGVKALYDADSDGNAVLQLRWGKSLKPGEEVTISYGDEKPASEMIFSYGFLDSATTEAREICLNIDMPDDDPLSVAKKIFCKQNRGVQVTAQGPEEQPITWESPLVWIACVNEEDGLNFGLAQTTDGGRELETTWKGEKVQSPDHLRALLTADPLWEIIQLRATVLLLERLETQLSVLQEIEEVIANLRENEEVLTSYFRPEIFELVNRYRVLEADLLEKAVDELIKQRTELLGSASVAAYFNQQTGVAEEIEDFS